jgi:hypothetical protein
MNDLTILIALHKESSVPSSEMFLPIQVGRKIAEKKLNIQGDDEGKNISEKNPNYCELTALYWAWKNISADIIGLCHYRRYFRIKRNIFPVKNIYNIELGEIEKCNTTEKAIEKSLSNFDIILAKPTIYPHSLEISYQASHISEDLDILTTILDRKYQPYSKTWERIMKFNNKLPPYNMFISKRDVFNNYCTWLFDILFEAEMEIKLSPYRYQQRVFGFLAERLLLLYCTHNKLKIKYFPIYFVHEGNFIRNPIHLYYLRSLKNNLSFYSGNPKAILNKLSF